MSFSIHGPIACRDLTGLSARLCSLLEVSGARLVLCDVQGVRDDAVAVEALALLQLAANRHGCRVRLINPSEELVDLVDLMGLSEVLTKD